MHFSNYLDFLESFLLLESLLLLEFLLLESLEELGFKTVALKLADFKLAALATDFLAAITRLEANFLLAVFKADIAFS